jgi:predicted dehydrogenase
MNVGVIGTGVMGKNHVRVYSKIREVQDICVFDSFDKHVDLGRQYDVVVCGSLDELLDRVDAVSICVPTEHHFEVVTRVVRENVHCLVEKPVTLTSDEGERLLDLLGAGLIVGVGHIERFNPIVDEIRKVSDHFCYCEIKRHNPGSARIDDSSVVKDLMIHDIDIVFNVLFKDKDYSLHSLGNADVCSSLVGFDDSVVSLSASRMSSKKIRSIYVEEEEFTVEGDFMLQEVYVYRKPERYGVQDERYTQENIIEKVLVNKVEPLFVELVTFVDCVKNHREFPVTVEQAVNNLRICEEIEKGFGWDILSMKQLS